MRVSFSIPVYTSWMVVLVAFWSHISVALAERGVEALTVERFPIR
jgi:hypothetical protein